jgi:hypothetical protein
MVKNELKLTPSDPSGRRVDFGGSVAISADGNTVLIGGGEDGEGRGAAWLFTRSGNNWIQQGAKLTPWDEIGAGGFGSKVALSADGNTALIAGEQDANGMGAVWVYTRVGSSWTLQGPKLTPNDAIGAAKFGTCVALSAHGNTALIGGMGDNHFTGATWVFTRKASTWTQQGPKLAHTEATGEQTGSELFGASVSLSADGNTALVGGPGDDVEAGAMWVFTRNGSTWSQQGTKLVARDESGTGQLGSSVALSADGTVVLTGGYKDNHSAGAAWVFTRKGSTWTQQGHKLMGHGEIVGRKAPPGTFILFSGGQFGKGVALSANGDSALVGGVSDNNGIGAAWLYTRKGSTWTQQEEKLTGTEELGAGLIGESVALSASGNIALLGGFADNNEAGAAWILRVTPARPDSTNATTTWLLVIAAVITCLGLGGIGFRRFHKSRRRLDTNVESRHTEAPR